MEGLHTLAEKIVFGKANTEVEFLRFASLRTGKTWEDVHKVLATKDWIKGFSFEQAVAICADRLEEVIESTTLKDDPFS